MLRGYRSRRATALGTISHSHSRGRHKLRDSYSSSFCSSASAAWRCFGTFPFRVMRSTSAMVCCYLLLGIWRRAFQEFSSYFRFASGLVVWARPKTKNRVDDCSGNNDENQSENDRRMDRQLVNRARAPAASADLRHLSWALLGPYILFTLPGPLPLADRTQQQLSTANQAATSFV